MALKQGLLWGLSGHLSKDIDLSSTINSNILKYRWCVNVRITILQKWQWSRAAILTVAEPRNRLNSTRATGIGLFPLLDAPPKFMRKLL